MRSSSNSPKVVDLFSGAGGLSLGFAWTGCNIVLAVDNDEDSIRTHSENIDGEVRRLDLCDVRKSLEEIQSITGGVDLVIGGPPCQGFSVQRRGQQADSRNDLVISYVKTATLLAPKAILMENVPTVLGPRGKKHIDQVKKILSKRGYRFYSSILEAADFGVPQYRRRAFIVGIKNDLPDFDFPVPTHTEKSRATVREAITTLPPVLSSFEPHPDVANHQRRRISPLNIKRISYVPEGGGRLDIPYELQLDCHKKHQDHRHLDVYGRMWWDRPSPTLTAMFDNFTRGRFAHPAEDRNITNREGARIQSFPDDFVFYGNQKSVARQIGNAVPPLLGQRVAEALLKSIYGR